PGGTPLDALLAGQFTGEGALVDREISTTLELPYQLVLGVALKPIESLELLADYQYTGWESFDVAHIHFEEPGRDTDLVLDYQNTHSLLVGAEYAAAEDL